MAAICLIITEKHPTNALDAVTMRARIAAKAAALNAVINMDLLNY